MAVFGLLSLEVRVPRQFARVCHSLNMLWGDKEYNITVIALHNCGKSIPQIFKHLKPLKISHVYLSGN